MMKKNRKDFLQKLKVLNKSEQITIKGGDDTKVIRTRKDEFTGEIIEY
jgi:hypothetical protein